MKDLQLDKAINICYRHKHLLLASVTGETTFLKRVSKDKDFKTMSHTLDRILDQMSNGPSFDKIPAKMYRDGGWHQAKKAFREAIFSLVYQNDRLPLTQLFNQNSDLCDFIINHEEQLKIYESESNKIKFFPSLPYAFYLDEYLKHTNAREKKSMIVDRIESDKIMKILVRILNNARKEETPNELYYAQIMYYVFHVCEKDKLHDLPKLYQSISTRLNRKNQDAQLVKQLEEWIGNIQCPFSMRKTI